MGFNPYRIVMKRHATNRSNRVRTGKAIHANAADIAFVRPQALDHKNTPFYPVKILGVNKNLPAIIANLTAQLHGWGHLCKGFTLQRADLSS